MRFVSSFMVLSLGLCLAACSKPAVPPAPTKAAAVAAKPAAPEPTIAPARVGAANALVPAALQAKIRFAPVVSEKKRHVGLLPVGWSKGFMPGSVKPAEGDDLGLATTMAVDTNCDGGCTAKDWAGVVAKVEFDKNRFGSAIFDRDETIPASADGVQGRLATATADGKVYITAAFWKTGAPRYTYCRVTLDGNAATAAPAFVEACRATVVRDWQ